MPALVDPNKPYIGSRVAAPAATGTAHPAATATRAAAPTTDWAALFAKLNQPIDYSALGKVASTQAAADTAAKIAEYRSAQDYANQQASLRAGQQGQLGLASSRYLEGLDLGGQTAGDYERAAAAQRAAAAGYSGGLQQTVTDAAAEVQRNLAATGSSQTALNQGQAAGNALYALGGALPAAQFGVTGPTVAAAMRALPAQTLGYAQTLAAGELGQGQQEAAKYNADIVTAKAGQAALTAKYLDTLSEAAREQGQDRIANFYKAMALKQKGEAQTSLDAYRTGQLKVSTFKANALVDHQNATLKLDAAKAQAQVDYQNARLTNDAARIKETAAHNTALEKLAGQNAANLDAYRQGQIDLGTFNANTSRINAKTSRINALKPSAAAGTAASVIDTSRSGLNRYYTNQYGKPTDQYGNPLKSGQRFVPIPSFHFNAKGKIVADAKPGKKKGPGGLTPLQTTKYSGIAQTIAQDFRNGYTVTNKDTGELEAKPPQSINAAIAEMQKKGVPSAIIAEVIAQWWPSTAQLGSQPR